jgi:hypothetical protein
MLGRDDRALQFGLDVECDGHEVWSAQTRVALLQLTDLHLLGFGLKLDDFVSGHSLV